MSGDKDKVIENLDEFDRVIGELLYPFAWHGCKAMLVSLSMLCGLDKQMRVNGDQE